MVAGRLPIDEVLPALVDALARAPAAVLQAPPGAGKTTRVPLALLDAGLLGKGQLVMLEPRRVAARAAAHQLAKNRGERAGATVGFQVRFETVASADTRILVVTEGILARRFLRDPTLDGVSFVVLDEFHERSIHTDLALAFLRELLDVRDDLKLLVMSATLDADAVARFLGRGAPVITSAGRPFPVAVTHVDKRDDRFLDERMAGAVRTSLAGGGAASSASGDVLCFLPGAPEIKRTQDRLLQDRALPPDVDVVPLYGALSPAEQDRATAPATPGRRRVILATNVAETSITIEGVTAVVDSGLQKIVRHDPATDRESLETVRISLASAEQRAGRAGRTQPGRCLRLWTKTEHTTLEPSHAPEILRIDLARTLLDVLAFHSGAKTTSALLSFFFESPKQAALDRAVALLKMLGAVDDTSGLRLTAKGKALADLPLHPRTGSMLLAAAPEEIEEVAMAAAILEDDRCWPRESARTSTDSDLSLLLEGGPGGSASSRSGPMRDVQRVQKDLVRLAHRLSSRRAGDAGRRGPPEASFKGALLAGFPDRLCKRRRPGAPEALMAGGRGVVLARESGVHDADLFVALALESSGPGSGAPAGAGAAGAGSSASARVRIAEAVTLADIKRLAAGAAPDLVTTRDEAIFDEARGTLAGVRRTRVGDLVIEEKPGIAVSPEAAQRALAAAFARDFARLFKPSDALFRLRFARKALPDAAGSSGARGVPGEHGARSADGESSGASQPGDQGWPPDDDDALKVLLPELCAGKKSIAEIEGLDFGEALIARLPWELKRILDDEIPTHIAVPTGNKIKVDYAPALAEGGQPILAVRLQELFGLRATPRIAKGRVAVVLHLLSPGYKPVQVTTDLESFWRTTYADVKKELRARYPRHSWPDDPLTAAPTARAKKRGT